MRMGTIRMASGLILCIIFTMTSSMRVPDPRFQSGESRDLKVLNTLNEVVVNVPNEKDVIYDYANKLVVYRFMDKHTQEPGPCYARPLEDGETFIAKGKVTRTGTEKIGKLHGTNVKVPKYRISKQVDKMCRNTNIFQLEEFEENGISKMSEICIKWKFENVCKRSFGWSVRVTITCEYIKVCWD